jgi:hypothetical protein
LKIQVTFEWGSAPKLASGSLLWRGIYHPLKENPLLLQLLLLCLLKGVQDNALSKDYLEKIEQSTESRGKDSLLFLLSEIYGIVK